jgi:hypothetical protein
MTVRTAERRRNSRLPAAFRAIVRDRRGRMLARGRTANISENGVFVMLGRSIPADVNDTLMVEMTVPADPIAGTRRLVTYRCRIVRRQQMGNMLGLGLSFTQKLN